MICQDHRKMDQNTARRLAESARRSAESARKLAESARKLVENCRDDLGAAASRRGETIHNRHRYNGKGKGRGKSNASNSTNGRWYNEQHQWQSGRNDSWRTPRAGPRQHHNRLTLRPKPTTSTGRHASDSGKGTHSKSPIHKPHLKREACSNRPR